MKMILPALSALLLLASCGVNWEKHATVVYGPNTLLRAEPKASAASVKVLRMYDEVDLTGEAKSEGQAKFLPVRFGKTKGWVYSTVVILATVPGIVTGKEKVAYKDRADGTPVGFLEPASMVLVKRGKKLTRPQEILFREGNFWKGAWVDPDSLSIDAKDIEIYTTVLPTVEEYLRKAEGAEGRKQVELAMAYLNDVEVKYQKSEFYPETIAKKKAELRDLLGEGGSAKEKVLETDTNNTYEIKK